jgi:tetratricopeptide (TPR) repeat protein
MLLADGLAHAHERGILHRDLKPANILLADDGRPMLLDFNLAVDTKLAEQERDAVKGGTLPYMSPEQLETLARNDVVVDARSDLYSLGVVLYEALTGRLPGSAGNGPVTLRNLNRDVSPAVEAMVQRCLQADPARRYPSARELYEDLRCHLNDEPLRHTPNPSWRERVYKWARRHPRLVSSTSVAALAGVLLLFLGMAWWLNRDRALTLEATEAAHKLHRDVPVIFAHLHSTESTPQQIADGIRLAEEALGPFSVLADGDWRASRFYRRLSEVDRQSAGQDVGMVLFLMARAAAAPGQGTADTVKIEQALAWNIQAETALGPGQRRTVLEQRARLLEQLGRRHDAQAIRSDLEKAPASSGERFLDLLLAIDRGKYRDSLEFLLEATRKEAGNSIVWLVLGNVYAGLGRHGQAASCYDTALALQPDFFWARFNRGLLNLERKQFGDAQQDFAEVIRHRPQTWEAHVNRALASLELQDYQGAVADLSEAMKKGAGATRVYFLRAHAFKQLGRDDDARSDHQKGMTLEPQDELSFIVRGKERLPADPHGGLADFDKALKLNPRSRQALQNKAHVLSERLGRTDEAVAVLNQALELHPDYVLARAGRAVLLARLKKNDQAIRDAVKALELEASALTHYQAACVYALTSQPTTENRSKALDHLQKAIELDPQWLRTMPRDRDLAALTMEPRFQSLLAAAVNLFPSKRSKR